MFKYPEYTGYVSKAGIPGRARTRSVSGAAAAIPAIAAVIRDLLNIIIYQLENII
jgi:hypothetical protein